MIAHVNSHLNFYRLYVVCYHETWALEILNVHECYSTNSGKQKPIYLIFSINQLISALSTLSYPAGRKINLSNSRASLLSLGYIRVSDFIVLDFGRRVTKSFVFVGYLETTNILAQMVPSGVWLSGFVPMTQNDIPVWGLICTKARDPPQ